MSETNQGACQRCGKGEDLCFHACPFAEEINDDHDPEKCNCCDDCRHECAMDI